MQGTRQRLPHALILTAALAVSAGAAAQEPSSVGAPTQSPAEQPAAAAVDRDRSVADTTGAPVPASRAELWRSWRQAKEGSIAEPQPSFLSRYVVAPARALFGEHGNFQLVLHGGHRNNSPAIGFRYERLALGHDYIATRMPNRKDLRFVASTSADGHNEIEARLSMHRIADRPLSGALTAGFERHPHDSFFGLGPDSRVENRSAYLFSVASFGADLAWRPVAPLTVGAGSALLRVRSGHGGEEGLPTVAELFPGQALPGFGGTELFLRNHAELALEWRDVPTLPKDGSFATLRVESYADLTESDLDFRRYHAEIQQYFPFFHEQRVIVLRGLATFTNARGDAGIVPFYFMPTLGHGDDLRGFKSFRFRDRHAMLMQAEYRWQAWTGIEMALFVDAGKVFSDLDQLDFSDLELAQGIGFRFHSRRDMVLRIDIARSAETIRPHVSFSHVF